MTELWGVSTRVLYLVVLAVLVAERLLELVISRRNERRLLARGAVEAGAGHYPVMVLLHAAFLISCPLEVWWLDRPFIPWLGLLAGLALLASMALRYWAISTLDGRWTTRVLVLPGAEPVTGGPYRVLRHPNYLAVVLEILAVPLLHTAWLTALVFTLANGLLLAVRIRSEEAALARTSDYSSHFASRPRFIPGAR